MILPEEWPRCRPWIEAALEHCGGTHAIEDIEAGVARALAGEPGGLYFLPGERCAMVLEHVRMPRKAVLNIFLAGGDLDELLGLADGLVTEAARRLGCDAISLNGRLGWKRVLASAGWDAMGVTLGKRVVHELRQEQRKHQGRLYGDDRPSGDEPDAGEHPAGAGHRG